MLNGGHTGAINRIHCGDKRRWAVSIREQPVVCVWKAVTLFSSFCISECSCILSQSGQNFTTYFWKHVKELFVKLLTSDWSAQLSENSYGAQSLFCAKHELPTEESYTTLTATALQLSSSRWNLKCLLIRQQAFHSSVYEYLKSGPLPLQ